MNPFGNWSPDTITSNGASIISITLNASNDVPAGTQVTLSFGATVTNGSAQFTMTPATQDDMFTFTIRPGEQKTIKAKYQAGNVKGQPKAKAICDMSVPAGVIANQNPQTSSSELWIR